MTKKPREIVSAVGTTSLEHARSLLSISEDNLRLYVAKAVNERDHEALWRVVEAWLVRKNSSQHTMNSYRKGVMELLEAWQGVNLLRPSVRDAELYILNLQAPDREADPNDLQSRGRNATLRRLSPASVRQRIAAARAFYDALRWTGATTSDPFGRVIMPKLPTKAVERVREKAYTDDEIELLARAYQDWDDRLILLLGAHAGLRVSEMLTLEWADIDLYRGRLTVRLGKGGITAGVTMSDELTRNLTILRNELFPNGSAAGPVLSVRSSAGVYVRLKRLWIDGFTWSGLEPPPFTKGVHGLRHYAGVRFARETGDLRKVRDHLRHASLSSTEVYAAAAEDTDEVRSWSMGFDDVIESD